MTIILIQPGNINFNIKVSDIANDGFILHVAEMLFGNQIAATGGGNNDVGFFNCLCHWFYFVTIHCSL